MDFRDYYAGNVEEPLDTQESIYRSPADSVVKN